MEDTPLLDVPGFDIVYDIPLEEFHLIKEGLTKKMLQRMGFFALNIDARRDKRVGTNYARQVLGKLNNAYCAMSVFSETSRRPRPLKLNQFKGTFNFCFVFVLYTKG